MTDAPSAAATTTITCNINFFTSPSGILKVVEVVLGLIAWTCATPFISWSDWPGRRGFTLFAFISCWLITLITVGIYTTGIHATSCSGFPWAVFETLFNCIASALYFIGSCLVASLSSETAASYISSVAATYGASAAFGFFTTIAYIIHTVFYFQKWRGVYPWQGCGNGGSSAVST